MLPIYFPCQKTVSICSNCRIGFMQWSKWLWIDWLGFQSWHPGRRKDSPLSYTPRQTQSNTAIVCHMVSYFRRGKMAEAWSRPRRLPGFKFFSLRRHTSRTVSMTGCTGLGTIFKLPLSTRNTDWLWCTPQSASLSDLGITKASFLE
jgi:hypothetical protein